MTEQQSIQKAKEIRETIDELIAIHNHYIEEYDAYPTCLEKAASILITMMDKVKEHYMYNEIEEAEDLIALLDTKYFER